MRGAAFGKRVSPCAAAGAFGLLLAIAPAAHADNDGGNTLTIDLTGRVRAHCGFKTPPPNSVTVQDLSSAGSLSEPFTLDCNTPFRLRVSSQNGTLALKSAAADAPAAFGQSDPYQLEVKFSTDLGNVDETCASTELHSSGGGCDFFGDKTGQGVSSGKGVALGSQGALNISWTAPTTTLVAGQYVDTLTIVVEPRS
jgi:hypothetical protein